MNAIHVAVLNAPSSIRFHFYGTAFANENPRLISHKVTNKILTMRVQRENKCYKLFQIV